MSVLVINGPNLNMLGQREPAIYGTTTLADIEAQLTERAKQAGSAVDFFQSNTEGAIIDCIQQEASGHETGIIINMGALAHTSIALRDCLAAVNVPVVEVHISNIHAREEFRRESVTAPVVRGVITGLGWRGYLLAFDYLVTQEKSG